jgi:outer membrane protein assembly factor BamA
MGAQETIPLGERFFNGGENSVRSLLQDRLGPRNSIGDPLGGTAYNVISIELRHRLGKSFSSSLFVDLGNISPDAPLDGSGEQQYNSRSELVAATFNNYFNGFRTGVGVGLQYLLPVGPMRIDLAFNPDRRENRGEKDMVINFSVGMAF